MNDFRATEHGVLVPKQSIHPEVKRMAWELFRAEAREASRCEADAQVQADNESAISWSDEHYRQCLAMARVVHEINQEEQS